MLNSDAAGKKLSTFKNQPINFYAISINIIYGGKKTLSFYLKSRHKKNC